MSAPDFLPGWYPLVRSADLRGPAISRTLGEEALNLWRGADGAAAALESGRWQPREIFEEDGWVFAALGHPATRRPLCPPLIQGVSRRIHLDGFVRAGVGDVGENILDTTHTSVVHQGYLRSDGARRQVEAELCAGETWISATYPPGAAPSGWGARMLGTRGYTITDTFRAPSIAEVTYTEGSAPVFGARFWLTPVSANETYVASTLAVPGAGLLAQAKLAALRLFFLRIFSEDRTILELITANRAAHGAAPLVFAPQDLLRPGINAILEGRSPLPPSPRIALRV